MKKTLVLALAGSAVLLGTPAFGETASYAYDALGRLVASVHDQGATATATTAYWIDAAGNRTKLATVSSSAAIVPVFRFEKPNGQHFYTDYFMEGQNAGLIKEGNAFSLFRQNASGMTPIFRCYAPAYGHHFLSTDSACEGSNVEGLMGYSSSSPGAGVMALYRFYNPTTGDPLITINYQESAGGGYTLEGTYGYVQP